jgi:hypothetical protein
VTPIVRWNERGRIFMVEYGNIRFAVNKNSCAELSAALDQAFRLQEAKERQTREEGRG